MPTCEYNVSTSMRPDLYLEDCGAPATHQTKSEFPERRCDYHIRLVLEMVPICSRCDKPMDRSIARGLHNEHCRYLNAGYDCYCLEGEWSCTCIEDNYDEIVEADNKRPYLERAGQ